MAVSLVRIEEVDAAFIYFGYEGGVNTPFLKLRYYVISSDVSQDVVYVCGSGCTVCRSRHTYRKSVGFCNPGNLIEIYKLGSICQFRFTEFEEEVNRTSDTLLSGRYKGKIIRRLQLK